MKDLFNMISGTSTGSMLAGALSTWKDDSTTEPMFWGQEMVEFYEVNAAPLFKSNKLAGFISVLLWTLIFVFWGGVFYLYGMFKYANPNKLKAQQEMHDWLLETKNEMRKEKQKDDFKNVLKAKLIQERLTVKRMASSLIENKVNVESELEEMIKQVN